MAAPPISERHLAHFHRRSPIKEACRVATTASITISTGLNVGDTIDGVTLADGDRVLVKDQGTASQNGIYLAGATPARDYDVSTDDPAFGFLVYVREGTTNGGTLWSNTNTTTPTIGSTSLTFDQFTSGGTGTDLGWFNVADYGAVGDGTTDDTTAISNTFDAADAVGGGVIYFPGGTSFYKTTSLITRTAAVKYHILGGGTRSGPAIIKQTSANTGVFKFAPSSGTTNRDKTPLIENLTILGAGGASSGRGVEFANDGHVENVLVGGFWDGLYLGTASYYSVIRNTTVTDCDHSGIRLVNTNNTTIDSCRVTGDWGSAAAPFDDLQYGIVIECTSATGGAIRIVNSSIEYFTTDGIWADGADALVIQGNWFESSQSSTGHAYIRLGPASNPVHGAVVSGNKFEGPGVSGFQGIKCEFATDIEIVGNSVTDGFGIVTTFVSSTGSTSRIRYGPNYTQSATTVTLPSGSIRTQPGTTITPSATGSNAVGSGPDLAFGDHTHALGGTVAGDLSGTLPNPTVAKINGIAVTGTPSVGQVPTATSSSAATWQTPSSSTSTGALLIADTHSTPIVFADVITNEATDDFLYAD